MLLVYYSRTIFYDKIINKTIFDVPLLLIILGKDKNTIFDKGRRQSILSATDEFILTGLLVKPQLTDNV